MSHTKEPWSYQASIPEEGYECFWIISRGRHISSFDGPQNDEQFSNVRRIVACVNACAGISQQYIEELNGETIAERQLTLIKQRDALLTALESLIDMDVSYQRGRKVVEAVENAIDTIARVKGQQ